MQSRRHPFFVEVFLSVAIVAVAAGCGSPPQYVAKDAGPDLGNSSGSGGIAGGGAGGHGAGTGGGTGGTIAGTGGSTIPPTGSGGVTAGGGGPGGPGTGGAAGAPSSTGGTAGGTPIGTGGMMSGGGGMKPATGGAGPGTGGTGGVPVGTGGVPVATGGTTPPPGSGGSGVTCTGTQKACSGTCIAATECCGGCSGNTPVCMNGTCVGKINSTTCSADAECGSKHCSDGVCCDMACTGQCEACNTTTAKGMCVASTTQRTPCGGTGTCASTCDGTQAHRTACVYPASTVSCGAAASCTSSMAKTAAHCDGAGACAAAMSMSCMFGCRTDGMPLCADSCPTNQSLCGGATCVDTASTAAHCGTACNACINGTPQCYQSNCVECLTNTDCRNGFHPSLGSSSACSNHICGCAIKQSTNVLTNPGFDTNLTGWAAGADSTISWLGGDGYGCNNSGLVSVSGGFSGVQQCAKIAPGQRYYFGMRYINSGSSPVYCRVAWHNVSDCSDGEIGSAMMYQGNDGSGNWASTPSAPTTSPAGANYAQVQCAQFDAGSAYFDQLYLNTNDSY